jgi:hypothetical protein
MAKKDEGIISFTHEGSSKFESVGFLGDSHVEKEHRNGNPAK